MQIKQSSKGIRYIMFNFLLKSTVLKVSIRHVNIVTRLRANRIKAVKLCNIFFHYSWLIQTIFFSYCLPNSSQDLWKSVNTLSRLNRQIILIYYFLAPSHLLPCSIPVLSFIVVSYTIFFFVDFFWPLYWHVI